MRLKVYLNYFIALVLVFSFFTPASAQFNSKTSHDIQLLLQEKELRSPAQRKIDSRLLQAVREKRGLKMVEGLSLEPAQVNANAGGDLLVDIKADVTDDLIKMIQSLSGKIIYSAAQYHTMRVDINLSNIEKVASLPEVKFIEPAAIPITVGSGYPARNGRSGSGKIKLTNLVSSASGNLKPAKATFEERAKKVRIQLENYLKNLGSSSGIKKAFLTGTTNSEGDRTHRADDARNTYGYAGQGIRIGLISDSYNATGGAPADVANGNLPGIGNPLGNTTPVTVVAESSGSDEGRAMMQIVHDLAPKAQLFFATANGGQAAFATNIQALRNAPNNCDIIIDDIYYLTEPVFQDGIIAQAVNTVTASGALYFSSAGNSGSLAKNTSGVFEGDFSDAGSPAFTNGTKTGTIHNFGTVSAPVNGDIITAVSGATTSTGLPSNTYNLNWADPAGASSNDYDLFLISSTGTIRASSTNIQSGTTDPYESIQTTLIVAVGGDRLVVYKTAASAVRAFNLNTNRGRLTAATNGQTSGHSSAANAFSVAATPAANAAAAAAPAINAPNGPFPSAFTTANKVEYFSSDGPRRIFYNANGTPVTPGSLTFASNGGVVRAKPDITAADGVATTVSGFQPFYGTSAAAPHAGAIAALLKSANPSLTTTQIRSFLTSTALDIEGTGYDINSGYGIIQAMQAMQAVMPTAMASLNIGTVTATEGSFKNNNGIIEPGEIGNLMVQLTNSSAVNATSVTAVVTTSTPGVTITQANSNYGTISAGGSVTNSTPFNFSVNSSVLCGTTVNFVITATYGGGSLSPQAFPFSITLSVPQTTTISSTLGNTPPTGIGYTVISGQQTGRIGRFSIPSTCASNNGDPGTNTTIGARQFDAYTFTNTGATQCVSVTLSNSNPTNIFCAAYNNSGFVPTSPITNYAAQSGTPSNLTFNVNVPAGQKFTLVVHDVNVLPASSTSYTLSVTMAGCSASPTCTAVTFSQATISAGAKGTSYSQTFTATGGSGTYIFSLSGDLPAGLSFSGNTLSGTPTQAGSFPITVTATDPAGCPGNSKNYTLVISGTAPASITATAGTPQTVLPGTAFPVALQATVKDGSNNPLSGVNVKFTAPPSLGASGTFAGGDSVAIVITNASGIAAAPTFTANTKTGSYAVTATVTGITPANFSLNNTCPASFVVTSNADSGPGTLREIVNNACAGGTVTFDPAVTLITLTSGELPITKALTITGPGANSLTISGNSLYRIFNIAAGTSTVSISGMTIRDGKPTTGTSGGGGILISNGTTTPGAVNITGCVITSNDATFSPNPLGGGIDNEGGIVTIDRSSVVNNIASFRGGAIQNQGGGSMVITNSTIAGNTAGTAGLGGGIRNGSGLPLTLTNCTIFGNTAQSGGNISILNGTVTFGNTIIAGGSLVGTGGTGPDISGTGFTSNDYNLIQNTATGTITGTTTHNITGVSPNLLPLANNGGTTPTLFPAGNSPAINTGNTALTSGTDQRGLARVAGGQADIGAIEANGYTFYYSKSSGNLEQLSTWGTNTDGTGTAPANFTSDNQIFTIRNNAAPMVADNWTVSGISSLLVGDGTNAAVVTVASGKTFIIGSSTLMTDQANSSMIFSPASNFITGTGATVNFNGRPITLKSDSTGTASIGRISGTLANATNVTVERYFSNKRAWRLLGAPFSTTTQTIKASLMEGATSITSDPNPGFGTHITTFTGDSRSANFDATRAASSIRLYAADNFNSDSLHTPNTTALVSANPSYFLFVRGNRSVDRTVIGAPSSATTLRTTGTVRQGALSLGITGTGFSLIPNAYPSAVDFDSVKAIAANSGINTFYVWDPSMSSTGQYRTITISGTAAPYTYTATPGSQDNSLRFIESGVSFFVPGSRTVSFTEATKSTGTPPVSLLRTAGSTETQLAVDLNTVNADNTTALTDGVRVIFDNSYSAMVDNDDAKKIEGFNFNLGINKGGEILSVEKRPLPNQNDSISLKMWYTNEGNYQFELKPANFSSLTSAYLYDRYLNTSVPVDLSSNKLINFSITADTMSAVANRFSIVFQTSSVLPVSFTGIKATQKNAGIQVDWNIATESSIRQYEVEKSADGVQFTKTNETLAKANNNGAVSYGWYDANPFTGNNYYRIKVISSNSSAVKYSQVVNVKTGSGKSSIAIYPNPVKDRTLSLQLTNQPAGKYIVQLFNALGQQIFTRTIEHTGGSATQTIQLNSLVSKGIYQVHVSNGDNKVNQQVIIE